MNTARIISIVAWETLRRARRRRHLPILLVASLAVAGAISYLTFFGTGQYQQFYCHMMMFVLPLLSVLVAVLSSCWVLPQQMADKTVHMMLARPVHRWQVVVGTHLGVCVTSLGAYAVFAALFLVALAWRGVALPPALPHALMLLALQICLFCALAMLISLLTTPAMTATVCIFFYFVGQWIQPTLVKQLHMGTWLSRASYWLLYVALPHLNYFDLTDAVVHQWPAAAWAKMVPVVAYGLGWTFLLLVLAIMRFKRCDL